MRRYVSCAAVMMSLAASQAAEIELTWKYDNGKTEVKKQMLEEKDYGYFLRIKKESIPSNTENLSLLPDFAKAKKGEDGYWVFADGRLGGFHETEGHAQAGESVMPMFGMKTPRLTFVAIVTGFPYYFSVNVDAKKGDYTLSMSYHNFWERKYDGIVYDNQLKNPYEDIAVEFHVLKGAEANYSGMARRYRKYQLDRKACEPIRARVKKHPELDYAVQAPEVRIRQGWKPVPSPKPDQTPTDEPTFKQVVTFDRVGEIVDEFKRQGIGKAELCLVGWNIGGHDGRWPQIFPVEPALGGEAKLRALIQKTQAAGYQIVPHGNFRDAYIIADCWDAEYVIKYADGTLPPNPTSWGGGRMYAVCPQRAYERFASRDMFQIAGLGFRGLGYFDVFSCVQAPVCMDPRHPLNERQATFYIAKIMELSRDAFGGSASESAWDHFCGALDSVLYVSFSNPAAKPAKMVDRLIPIWQLVYNGIIVSNPFTKTVNFTAQDRVSFLKLLEFGGRPNFYFYSKFKSDGKNWMGDGDLGCASDEELKASVAKIKQGWDIYSKLSYLQYAFMESHDQIAADVFRTSYSEGSELVTNYGKNPYSYKGKSIPSMDYALFR